MSKRDTFAKLFELPGGGQVLYYLDEKKLVQRTDLHGMTIELNPGFKTEEDAELALQEMTEAQAIEFRATAERMLDEMSEL